MTRAEYGSNSVNVEHNETTNLIDNEGFMKSMSETDSNGGASNNNSSDDLYESETWREYLLSWRFLELVLCVVPVLLMGMYFEFVNPEPMTDRPIPFQYAKGGSTAMVEEGIDASSDFHRSEGGDDEYKSYTNIIWRSSNLEENTGETVSHVAYIVWMGFAPWLLQVFMAWFLAPQNQRSLNGIVNNFYRWDVVHRTTCVYFAAVGLTDAVINFVKYYVSYLRPVFFDFCQPYYDDKQSEFRCLDEEDADTINARLSFPSNHSGWSFCGMMLFSMYLERRFGLSSISNENNRCAINNGPSNSLKKKNNSPQSSNTNSKKQQRQRRNREASYRLLSLLCYSPMLIAAFIAASRVVDNRHFPADVIGGSVIGASTASLVFGIWFPQ
ncbi:unnamed protein product [Pseudo-nitzschia multistriata]|uniref:Phosphatidic acid phosphatase type 2/haloperoxidase domain-containing protein n=1 Tax=Pseudo-nitzschia multistriata TaxID=183589 RepID=A0A448YWN4_9STRA|nr:unnamed protein product [Pseudo-nitzschia multistriata]